MDPELKSRSAAQVPGEDVRTVPTLPNLAFAFFKIGPTACGMAVLDDLSDHFLVGYAKVEDPIRAHFGEARTPVKEAS